MCRYTQINAVSYCGLEDQEGLLLDVKHGVIWCDKSEMKQGEHLCKAEK